MLNTNVFLHFTCQLHRAAGTVVSSFFKVAVGAVSFSFCLFSHGEHSASLYPLNATKRICKTYLFAHFWKINIYIYCYAQCATCRKQLFIPIFLHESMLITCCHEKQYETVKHCALSSLFKQPSASPLIYFLSGLKQPWPFVAHAAEGQSHGQPERTHCAQSLRWDNCFFSLFFQSCVEG